MCTTLVCTSSYYPALLHHSGYTRYTPGILPTVTSCPAAASLPEGGVLGSDPLQSLGETSNVALLLRVVSVLRGTSPGKRMSPGRGIG